VGTLARDLETKQRSRFGDAHAGSTTSTSKWTTAFCQTKGEHTMLLLLAFLVVLLFAGLGFALHFLWIVAVILLVLWLVGFVVGRGEGAGSRRFYRW
jgi:fatty-acid desaturase